MYSYIVVKDWKSILMNNLLWLIKDDKNFETSTECWICDDTFVEGDVKVGDPATWKFRSAAHRS